MQAVHRLVLGLWLSACPRPLSAMDAGTDAGDGGAAAPDVISVALDVDLAALHAVARVAVDGRASLEVKGLVIDSVTDDAGNPLHYAIDAGVLNVDVATPATVVVSYG